MPCCFLVLCRDVNIHSSTFNWYDPQYHACVNCEDTKHAFSSSMDLDQSPPRLRTPDCPSSPYPQGASGLLTPRFSSQLLDPAEWRTVNPTQTNTVLHGMSASSTQIPRSGWIPKSDCYTALSNLLLPLNWQVQRISTCKERSQGFTRQFVGCLRTWLHKQALEEHKSMQTYG